MTQHKWIEDINEETIHSNKENTLARIKFVKIPFLFSRILTKKPSVVPARTSSGLVGRMFVDNDVIAFIEPYENYVTIFKKKVEKYINSYSPKIMNEKLDEIVKKLEQIGFKSNIV